MGTNVGRERKPITVLFADVVDSTAMAEQMDPEDWAATMNSVFDLMAEAVQRYEGTVAQFLGDGILAFFGAPTAHEDDPERAVRAALHMLDAVERFAKETEADTGGALQIRIGVNTGPVILGSVGSLGSGGYSAMGDTLNTAARVQAAARPSSVAVTENTYRLISSVFAGEDLGDLTVKGKSAPVHCHRIIGPRRADTPAESVAVGDAPIVGREGQISDLVALGAAAQKGRGGAVFLVGEPGIGKTRLVGEVKSRLSSGSPDLLWLEGKALSYGVSVPYGLVVQLVRSLFGTGLATNPDEAAELVGRQVRELADSDADEALAYIAHLLSIPIPGASVAEEIEPEDLQQRYVDALTLLLRSTAARRPILVVCEDLHWADPSSAAVLSKLLTVAQLSRVLFVFTMRRDPHTAGWRLLARARDLFGEALTQLSLEPLSPADSAAFAEQLLGSRLPQSVSKFLFDVTEGNPLFIEEVVRTYLSSVSELDYRSLPLATASLLEGSYSLHTLLLASIDRLGEHGRRLLKVAAVIGREFSSDVLAEVVHGLGEDISVAEQLSSLEAGGVVRVSQAHPELQYSFRHSLLQEAAYGSLLKSERRKVHGAVGSALETLYPERTDELAGLLARHFGDSGQEEKALTYSVVAADAAFRRYATAEAAAHYARAADIASKTAEYEPRLAYLFLQLGRSLELSDRYDEAVDEYRRLIELGRDRGAPEIELTGLVAAATSLVTPAGRQDIPEAERLARRALGLARQIGDRAAEGRSLWNLMLAYNFSGREPGTSIRFGEEALAIGRELGRTEQVASTLLDLHWSYLANGELDRSSAALEEATALWRGLGDKAMLADSLASSSGLKLFAGDFQGVVDDAEAACAASAESGSLWGQSYSRLFAGYAYLELGRPDVAITVMGECVRLAEESNSALQVGPRADLGLTLVELGSPEEGLAQAERALEVCHRFSGAFAAWARASAARVFLLLGDLEKADSLLQPLDAAVDARLFMPLPIKFPLGLAKAEVAVALGRHDEALLLSRSMVQELERLGLKFWLPRALFLQARATLALGNYDEGLTILEAARSSGEEIGASWSLRPVKELWNGLGRQLHLADQRGERESP